MSVLCSKSQTVKRPEFILITYYINSENIVDSICSDSTLAVCNQLKEAFAIVSMATKDSMEVFNSFGRILELPFIVATGPRVHQHDDEYSLFMTPSYIPAVVDYILHNQWKRVHYMYDSDDGIAVNKYNICTKF